MKRMKRFNDHSLPFPQQQQQLYFPQISRSASVSYRSMITGSLYEYYIDKVNTDFPQIVVETGRKRLNLSEIVTPIRPPIPAKNSQLTAINIGESHYVFYRSKTNHIIEIIFKKKKWKWNDLTNLLYLSSASSTTDPITTSFLTSLNVFFCLS